MNSPDRVQGLAQTLAQVLAPGSPCIVATDTVYGLAAPVGRISGDGERAARAICALKGRPDVQVPPWLVPDAEVAFGRWACDVPVWARRLGEMFWPGALTLVLPASSEARAAGGCAPDGSIALRVPGDEALRAAMRVLDAPLSCSSANLHGRPAPVRREDIDAVFLALPGAGLLPPFTPDALASTVVDCTGAAPRVLREGAVSEEAVMEAASAGAPGMSDATGASGALAASEHHMPPRGKEARS